VSFLESVKSMEDRTRNLMESGSASGYKNTVYLLKTDSKGGVWGLKGEL